MTLNTLAIRDSIIGHAQQLGVFERVVGHEPMAAPGPGITASVWADSIEPVARRSGLAATSVRLTFNVRCYQSMQSQPEDDIDVLMLTAVDALLNAYSGDFDLSSTVAEVDLLGMYGVPLSARAGYLNQDNILFRVMVVTLPVIVNDLWTQVV